MKLPTFFLCELPDFLWLIYQLLSSDQLVFEFIDICLVFLIHHIELPFLFALLTIHFLPFNYRLVLRYQLLFELVQFICLF